MTTPDLAAVAWEQLLTDAITGAGLTDRHDLVHAIATEMPLDLASASVAQVLADRHKMIAAVYQGIADGLVRSGRPPG